MHKSLWVTLVLAAYCLGIKGQVNLVPNPSFEEYNQIPCNGEELKIECKYWTSGTGGSGSPDYYSRFAQTDCYLGIPQSGFGYQNAKEGNFYVGIFLFGYGSSTIGEYIESKLLEPLLPKKYCVEFFVSLADSASAYAVNNIGAYFSVDTIFTSQSMRLSQFTPQILNINNPLTNKLDWTKISGEFVAQGGDRYITIGNFNTPANDDTVYVGNYGVHWGNGISYIYIDSVSVTLCDGVGIEENKPEQLKIYPNPASNIITIHTGTLKDLTVELYDMAGRKLITQKCYGPSSVLDVSGLTGGMYVVTVLSGTQVVKRERVVVTR